MAAIADPPVLGLAVTVGAEQTEVPQPVIEPVAIDMMQLQRDGPVAPLAQAAGLAALGLQTGLDQPQLHVVSPATAALGHHRVVWLQPGPVPNAPQCNGVRP